MMKQKPQRQSRHTVVNPSEPGALREIEITDRAKRYRAQNAIEQSEHRCIYCGAPQPAGRKLDVEHIDGVEDHTNPQNLAYSCRACNVRKGRVFARAGIGRKTRQRNPSKGAPSEGAKTWKQYTAAVMALKGYSSDMELKDAIELMHATPPERRSKFASQLYAHQHRAGREEVPF